MKAEIAVLTVIPEELKWAQKAFSIRPNKDHRKAENGTNYWHGSVRSHIAKRDYSIVLTCIGYAGNYNSAAATSDVINEYGPKVVLLIGIAAGLRDKVKIGEVVLSERVVAYETAAIDTGEHGEEEFFPRPDMPRIEHMIEQDIAGYLASLSLSRIERKFRSLVLEGTYPTPSEGKEKEFRKHVATEAKIKTATIASGEKLLRHPDKLYVLRRGTHGRIEVGEMEAAGIEAACRRHRVLWLVIRGISDFGDQFKDDRFHDFAAKMAAVATRDFIAYGLNLGTRRSRFPQAYDETAHGDMLSGEQLSKEDLEKGRAVKPRQVEEIVQALTEDKSVAVQGAPGSGKSALAAWANWIGEKKGQLFVALSGSKLQGHDVEAAVRYIEKIPSDHILIIDDIHLAERLLAHLKSLPWAGERRFLLLGRTPYVDRVMRSRGVPRIRGGLINITAQDSMDIAYALTRKYLPDDAAAQLLHHTRKDLVLTKWLLEAVVLHGASPDSTPKDAAIVKLEALREDWKNGGDELVRLFLTLAAFSWAELWCPEAFLADTLDFEIETMETLWASIHESERQRRLEAQGGYVLRLSRHPKLCELFLDAAPGLGIVFDRRIFAPTCTTLRLQGEAVKSYGFASLILGAAVAGEVADLDTIEWRLVYGGRSSDYVNIVKVAAELSQARYEGPSDPELPLEEKVKRIKFAYAAANGERRLHGGQAAKLLLERLRQQLGVIDVPSEPFSDKGYILYQDAYLMRLNNAGQAALDRFEESAAVDELWAAATGSLRHRGKATMSRIAAYAYSSDLAVFAQMGQAALYPDKVRLQAALRALKDILNTLDALLSSRIEEKDLPLLEGFRMNALLHLAEVAGWLGDEAEVNLHLNRLEPGAELNDFIRRAISLAKGALALTKGQYKQAIAELQGQHKERVEFGAGEGAGKTGVILLISYLQFNSHIGDAIATHCWLLSNECPTDAGNGLAKIWAAKLEPIRGVL